MPSVHVLGSLSWFLFLPRLSSLARIKLRLTCAPTPMGFLFKRADHMHLIWVAVVHKRECHVVFFFFLSVDLWYTSRVRKSLRLCSHSSPCSWTSSQRRSAQCRRPWKQWWHASPFRATPLNPNRRSVYTWALFQMIYSIKSNALILNTANFTAV